MKLQEIFVTKQIFTKVGLFSNSHNSDKTGINFWHFEDCQSIFIIGMTLEFYVED